MLKKTFHRLLKIMGYCFRKIDNRQAVLQREDLTKWRGRYLKRLRDNEKTAVPKKLVYIDEVSEIKHSCGDYRYDASFISDMGGFKCACRKGLAA